MSITIERKAYASDLTTPQWQLLEPLLPEQKEGGRRATRRFAGNHQRDQLSDTHGLCLRDVAARSSGQVDLPAKSTVYEYYRAWQQDGTWQRVHDVLRSRVRQQFFQRRFSSVVDQPRLEKVWADGGYRGAFLTWTKEHCAWEVEIVSRAPDQKGFVVLPNRWVVERTFGWLNRYRLLSKEYEATFESSTADIQIAMSSLMLPALTKAPKPCPETKKTPAHVT